MFSDSLSELSRLLGRAGYHTTREPIDISSISTNMIDCEVIARNDEYNILYMEAESNWRSIARSVAESQSAPCLVATKYENSVIMTTIQDKMTRNPKPRHIVISQASEKYGLSKFVKMIYTTEGDDFLSIDERVQEVFDVFSKYDEALKKFGENLNDVIKDTKNLITSRSQKNKTYLAESKKFAVVCKEILNDTIQQKDVTSMLIQHVITAKIFTMIYDSDFVKTNSIARELERLRDILDIPDDLIDYSEILLVAESITSDEGRQHFIRQIYETFYKKYDPKRADRDGIVYTPIEVVDFILNSVQHVLQEEFGTDFSDRSVKVLDPFAGTGTFLARLLASGMLGQNISTKYKEDIFANELLLLAFYIATVNMESTYANMVDNNREYYSFEGMNYTDTFMMNPRYLEDKHHRQEETKIDEKFIDIQKRRQKQRKSNLHVIIANPPYMGGQEIASDNSQAIRHHDLEKRIRNTYTTMSRKVGFKGAILKPNNAYFKALRWASDRIGNSGVMGFITPSSYIRDLSTVGVRACLNEEFTDIWCFDLRGHQQGTKGDESRREGGKLFGSKSREGTVITILVKNPNKTEHTINYFDIGDYLKTSEKLQIIKNKKSIKYIDWKSITPDKMHNWLNQPGSAGEQFKKYVPMGSKEVRRGKHDKAIFKTYSRGIGTSRDAWVYNSIKSDLEENMKQTIRHCNKQDWKNSDKFDKNDKKIAWTAQLSENLKKIKKPLKINKSKIRIAVYRPFIKQYLYFDEIWNEFQYHIPEFFPNNESYNPTIIIPDKINGDFSILNKKTPDLKSVHHAQTFPLKHTRDSRSFSSTPLNPCIIVPDKIKGEFSVFITNITPDLHVLETSQVFPMKVMELRNNITGWALGLYQSIYHNNSITKEDIFYYTYGVLHSPRYRDKYQASLVRGIPHIPMAPDFWAYSKGGKKLANLHLNYENCPRYDLGRPLDTILDNPRSIRFGRKDNTGPGPRTTDDHTTLIIDGAKVFDNLPECVYKVNGRTPVGWLTWIPKPSKAEIDRAPFRYMTGKEIHAMVERLVHVGSESDKIISELPEEFEGMDTVSDQSDTINTLAVLGQQTLNGKKQTL